MDIIDKIFGSLNIKALGQHLANYLELYTHPLSVWKKVISNRKTSYDITVLHLIYYLTFVLLLIDQSTKAIVYVLAEAAATIIPFLLLFIPFRMLTKAFKKKIRWNRLFRLLLILKLQFCPILVVVILAIRFFESESLFIVLDNLIGLFIIVLIITMPLVLALHHWQKVVWIL